MGALAELAQHAPIIFPCHPRTRAKIEAFHLAHYFTSHKGHEGRVSGLWLCEPLGYLDFLKLMARAKIVLTDSGGIQEETTILGIPCLSLRETTERPVTVSAGTNILVGVERDNIVTKALEILYRPFISCRVPELWDGYAAKRIVQILLKDSIVTT
jgi:UDP-N-acetylglucosamine 2-epimerase (non-hydrolysing)